MVGVKTEIEQKNVDSKGEKTKIISKHIQNSRKVHREITKHFEIEKNSTELNVTILCKSYEI